MYNAYTADGEIGIQELAISSVSLPNSIDNGRSRENAMAFVPVANTCLAELVMSLDGQVVENTLWFELQSGSLDLVSMGDLAAVLRSWWASEYADGVADDLSLNLIRITDMSTSSGLLLEYNTSLPANGLVVDESLPNSIAAVVQFRSNQRGRSYRGRNYIPGIPGNSVVVNTLLTAYRDAFVTTYENLQTLALAEGWLHVIVSRFSGGATRPSGITTPVMRYFVDGVVHNQRRRTVGVGI